MKKTLGHIHEILKITQDFSAFNPSVHLLNIAHNLSLIADLGYGSMSLALAKDDELIVVAARRTTTAIGPEVKQRVGHRLPEDELEAYASLKSGHSVYGSRIRSVHDLEKDIVISYVTSAHPIFGEDGGVVGVLLRDVAQAQHDAPGRMESEFMQMSDELIDMMAYRALQTEEGEPFVTTRRPGDGVLRIDALGHVEYPSPNAVAILRLAGYESRVRTSHASELPGGGFAIASVINKPLALKREVSVAGRTLLYRSIGLQHGAVVFIEDVTELRKQQQEVEIKEATIREVHHRVKNNLQTVAALLRMQGRRTTNDETKEALSAAVERINSMATVHALLSSSEQESLDLLEMAQSVVSSIEASMRTSKCAVEVIVAGEGEIILPAHVITSLALVLTELVHNAYEHGLNIRTNQNEGKKGAIRVDISQNSDMIIMEISDNGKGLPEDFDVSTSQNLGLSIVKTIVSQDLNGELFAYNSKGAHFQVRIPRGEWE